MKQFIVFVIFITVLNSCKKESNKIIGNWISESCLSRDGETITFKSNTTYLSNKTMSSTITFGENAPITFSGTWNIMDGKLETSISASSNPELIQIGETYSDNIIEITDEKMTYIDKNDNYCEEYKSSQLLEREKNKITINPEKYPKHYIEQVVNMNECMNTLWKATKEIQRGDFNNDGATDYLCIMKNEESEIIKGFVIHGKSNELFEFSLREDLSVINKNEMKKGFGNNIGDGIMDMCKECVPIVYHWNGQKYESSGYFW